MSSSSKEITRTLLEGSIQDRVLEMSKDRCPPELIWPMRLFRRQVSSWDQALRKAARTSEDAALWSGHSDVWDMTSEDLEDEFVRILESGLCTPEHLDILLRDARSSLVLGAALTHNTDRSKEITTKVCSLVARNDGMCDKLVPLIWKKSPEALLSYRRLSMSAVETLIEDGLITECGKRASNGHTLYLDNFPESVYRCRVASRMVEARLHLRTGNSFYDKPALHSEDIANMAKLTDGEYLREVFEEVHKTTQHRMLALPNLPLDLLQKYEDEYIYFLRGDCEREEWHRNIVRNPNCPENIRRRVWEHAAKNPYGIATIVALAKDPNTPADLLGTLVDLKRVEYSDRLNYYKSLLENPNTPQDMAIEISWKICAWSHHDLQGLGRPLCETLLKRAESFPCKVRDMVTFAFQEN